MVLHNIKNCPPGNFYTEEWTRNSDGLSAKKSCFALQIHLQAYDHSSSCYARTSVFAVCSFSKWFCTILKIAVRGNFYIEEWTRNFGGLSAKKSCFALQIHLQAYDHSVYNLVVSRASTTGFIFIGQTRDFADFNMFNLKISKGSTNGFILACELGCGKDCSGNERSELKRKAWPAERQGPPEEFWKTCFFYIKQKFAIARQKWYTCFYFLYDFFMNFPGF